MVIRFLHSPAKIPPPGFSSPKLAGMIGKFFWAIGSSIIRLRKSDPGIPVPDLLDIYR
jgi:hypothetical protein